MKSKNKTQKSGVGAPEKPVKYPRSRFTVERAVSLNDSVCELTVRNRIKKDVKAGLLVAAGEIKQPKGGVGRPKFSYILKALAKGLKTKTPKTPKVKTVKTVKATPASTPVVSVTAPAVPATPVPTTPAVTTPATEKVATEVTPATLP